MYYISLQNTETPCVCEVPERERKHATNHQVNLLSIQDNQDLISAITDNIELPSRLRIRAEQYTDDIIRMVKGWVTNGQRPQIQVNRTSPILTSLWKQFNLLKIEDNILMRKWISTKDPEESKYLTIVPESLIEDVMRLFHNNITSCHPGANICLERCRQFFYWYKMEDDFKEFVAACPRCQETKQPHSYLRAPLKHIFFHHFNDAICVDHIVPDATNRTARGYRYILTITDCYSNYLVAVPVKTQTSKENIRAIFRHWILIFGVCKELIVDNHPGFSSIFFAEVFKAFDCKKTHGTSYKSRSTGRAEKSNKRINQALRACIPQGKENQWDLYLSYAVFALNSLKNRNTGYSANRMVFSRELNTPLSILVDNDGGYEPTTVDNRSKEAYELRKTMKRTIKKVRENAELDYMYAKNYHDRNILGPFFKENDLCYVLINCPTHKFAPRWRGPFRVTEVVNDHLYKVHISPGQSKITNISKMKHYRENRYTPHISTLSSPENHQRPSVPHKQNDDSSEDEDDFISVNIHLPEVRNEKEELSPQIPAPDRVNLPYHTQRTREAIPTPNSSATINETEITCSADPELENILGNESCFGDTSNHDQQSRRYELRNRSLIHPPDRYV